MRSWRFATPTSSCTPAAGCGRGARRRGFGRLGPPEGCSRRSSWSSSTRKGWRAAAAGRWRWSGGAGAGRRTAARRGSRRWPGPSSCATAWSRAGAPTRTASGRCERAASPRGLAEPPGGRRILCMSSVAPDNAEATEAWSGPLFEIFVKYRDLTTGGLGAHGEEAMRANPPRAGERVLDVGCGFGDTTRRLAELVGPEGSALGVDVSPPFIETAQREAGESGKANVEFRVADVQTL